MREEQATHGKGTEERSIDEDILVEQVGQVYALGLTAMAATPILAAISFFVLLQADESKRLLLFWLVAVLVVTFLRVGLHLQFRKRFRPQQAALWGKYFLVGLALVGAVWGCLGIFPLEGTPPIFSLFITFVLGGMAAGSAAIFSSLKWGFFAFGFPALLPLGIHFLLVNSPIYVAMGCMVFLFFLLLWRLSEYIHQVVRTSLRLRFENREIIHNLQVAKDDAEDLSRTLLIENDAKQMAEAELKIYQNHLKTMVAERTRDLLRANEELTITKDAAEAANRAKSEFLANMSHEIRTPLAGALGMLDLVLEMPIGDEERQLLEMARRSAESLLYLISDLLDFARMEAGTLRLEKRLYAPARAIRTATEVVSLIAQEKGLCLSRHVDPAVPRTLEGDEARLRQVLVNLLGNAVKFTDCGEVAVKVCVKGDDGASARKSLLFSVIDTGIGIPVNQIEKIFEKFTQVDPSMTRKYGGTGLGLALSCQIIERMGGRIWAESRPGEGSTFYFTLPLDA